MKKQMKARNSGGATIEYLMVSLFALALTASGLAILHKTIKDHLQSFGEKLEHDLPMDELDELTP